MILSFEALPTLRGKVVMVDGGFDPLHLGHVTYFRLAAERGLPVFCNVSSDDYVGRKHKVFMPQEVRCQLIDALRNISFVHASSRPTAEILEHAHPVAFLKGSSWRGRLPASENQVCQRLGIGIEFLDSELDSSTARIEKFLGAEPPSKRLAAFEAKVRQQTAPDPAVFDREYYIENWRKDTGSNYSIEERRRIEARHPELIRDTFAAHTYLDVGCGPGALMYLLQEQGLQVEGIDFSEASRALAPATVRNRIRIGSLHQLDIPDASYEVVICREVLEHMTVLQVQKAVESMCRICSRYVYVTTRFHPNPSTILDLTTEFHVDPTHITLMHKDMLRLMFILQGMRQRADLEQKLDWLRKGRVLVYEKI